MPRFSHALPFFASLLLIAGVACTTTGTTISAPTPASTAKPASAASPSATSPSQQLEAAAQEVDKAIAAAQAGDLAKAKHEFEEFDEDWDKIEDGIKAKSPDAYKAIEDAMDEVEVALVKSGSPSKDAATAALQKLRRVIDEQKPKLG